MRKHNENLFQIGEVTKIMGVTRKALLVYEELGLLTPAVKDEESGYRYYTADNMTQIRSIRSIYMEGPPNRGSRSEDYITQIAVPIKG